MELIPTLIGGYYSLSGLAEFFFWYILIGWLLSVFLALILASNDIEKEGFETTWVIFIITFLWLPLFIVVVTDSS